jgi:dCMP deaminase
LSWKEYFMATAFLAGKRSKDPSTQVGACIVNKDKRIVGIGYNGMPNGISDNELPWSKRAQSKFDKKCFYGKKSGKFT